MGALYALAGLTDRQLERLDDAGVSYSTENLQPPTKSGGFWNWKWFGTAANADGSVTAVLVDGENLQLVLQYLGAREANRKRAAPENTFWLELAFDREPQPVVAVYAWFDGGEGPDPAPFVQIVRETLLPHAERDILIHAGKPPSFRKPQPDGLIHLYLASTPSANVQIEQLPTAFLFGTALGERVSVYELSNLGVPIYDDDHVGIGEIIGNEVYCLAPIVHLGGPAELKVFRRFCEETNAMLHLSEAERAERARRSEKREEESRRALYLKHCAVRRVTELEGAKRRLTEAEALVEKTRAAYFAALNRVERESRLVDTLTNQAAALDAKLSVEFDRFHNDPKFIRVVPFEGGIRVYTRVLYCYSKSHQQVRKIGEMLIEILVAESALNAPIRIYNLTHRRLRKVRNSAHPHVGSEGQPCLGNSASLFKELVRNRELYGAAAYAVQFIECVNGQPQGWEEWELVSGADLKKLRDQGLLPVGA